MEVTAPYLDLCFDLLPGWNKEIRKTWFYPGGVVPIDSRRKGRELMNWIWDNEVYSHWKDAVSWCRAAHGSLDW